MRFGAPFYRVRAMLIKVSDIPEEGLKAELSEPEDTLAGLGGEIRPLGPVKGSFFVKLAGSAVYVSGTVKADLELECSRCGKVFDTKVEAGFAADLYPEEGLPDEEEKELAPGEMDAGYYKGGEIDLTALLVEQLALNLPMKPLCSEACRGVCQFCGQDLNEEECGCEAPSGHPGFGGLKDLLERMKEEGAKKEDGESD